MTTRTVRAAELHIGDLVREMPGPFSGSLCTGCRAHRRWVVLAYAGTAGQLAIPATDEVVVLAEARRASEKPVIRCRASDSRGGLGRRQHGLLLAPTSVPGVAVRGAATASVTAAPYFLGSNGIHP